MSTRTDTSRLRRHFLVVVLASVLVGLVFVTNACQDLDESTSSVSDSTTSLATGDDSPAAPAAPAPADDDEPTVTEAPADVPPSPRLVSPADGATFSHFPRTTTFVWEAVPGAASYLVEFEYQDVSAGTWHAERRLTPTGTTVTFNWVGAQPGRWRVTAKTADDVSSPPSDWQIFEFTR